MYLLLVILYPLFLKGKENYLPRLYIHADKLIFGGIFSDYFIKYLKKRIIFSFKSANEPFDCGVLEKYSAIPDNIE